MKNKFFYLSFKWTFKFLIKDFFKLIESVLTLQTDKSMIINAILDRIYIIHENKLHIKELVLK
jgi:hypothetical protein